MSKRVPASLAARGAVAVARAVAVPCALGIALLALGAALAPRLLPDRGEHDAQIIEWIDPLALTSGRMMQNATDGDRALRSYLTMGHPGEEDDTEFDRSQAAVRNEAEQLRKVAAGADADTRKLSETFVHDVEAWLDFANALDKKAHTQGRSAAQLALITGVGTDSLTTARGSYEQLAKRLEGRRDDRLKLAVDAAGGRDLGLLVALALAAAASALAAWLAVRASRVVRPPAPAVEVAQLRAVLDKLPDGVAIAAPDGSLVVSNLAAGRVLELANGTPRGVALYHDENEPLPDAEDPLRLALAGERTVGRELFVQRQNGGLARVTVSASPVVDEHGDTIAAVATFEDPGAREQLATEAGAAAERAREAEAELATARANEKDLIARLATAESSVDRLEREVKSRENRLDPLFDDKLAVGFALFDARHLHLVDANEAGLALLGERRRARDVRGSKLADIVPGAESSGLAEIFRRAAAGDAYSSEEYRCDGLRHGAAYWRFSLVPIPGAAGAAGGDKPKPADLLLAGVDVTATVEAREASAQAIERERRTLESVIDKLPEAVVFADAEGTVRAANRAALALGTPASGVAAGSDVADFAAAWRVTPTAGGPMLQADAFPLARALRGEAVSDLELTVHGTGTAAGRPVRISAHPVVGEARQPVGAVLVASTVRREAAKTSASLNGDADGPDAHRFEDSLLAISNDLRTPVVSIQGMVELFRQKYAEAVPDVTALHYLELTQRNAEQISQIITDLVGLSDLGRSSVSITDVPLSQAVEEAWRASPRGGIDLRVAGPLPVVRADKAKVTRALRDIFDMAVRWRGDEAISWVHVAAKDLGPQWEIEVTDNGKGFGAAEAESLFGPLARSASARSHDQPSQIGAVGIGLAAVRRIAELHGGAATVSSTPGQGATYSITIDKPAKP